MADFDDENIDNQELEEISEIGDDVTQVLDGFDPTEVLCDKGGHKTVLCGRHDLDLRFLQETRSVLFVARL